MHRREFLKNTASGIIIPSLAGGVGLNTLNLSNLATALTMAEESDRSLILLYMGGGNDGLNTLVPMDQLSALNKVRPHVVLPEDSLLHLEGTDCGFHPAFQEMKQLFDDERLSIIQNVGYPSPDFSHFRSTDIWMSASSSEEVVVSGWTGRLLNNEHPEYPINYPNKDYTDPLAIEIGWTSSMMFQGENTYMGMVINDPESFYELIDEDLPDAPDTKAGDKLEYVRLVAKQSQLYGSRIKEAAQLSPEQIEYPEDNSLANQLKVCARLIAGGLKTKLYLVNIGGFDTHDNQVNENDHTKGRHALLLERVSKAIGAFMQDCENLGISDKVLGMTFSEFGRRVVSNASLGTDHGTTAPLFLFGNKVKAGIIGNNPDIPEDAEYWYNLEMEHDFRQVYASVLTQWLCVPKYVVNQLLFKNFETLQLVDGTLCESQTVNTKDASQVQMEYLKVFPNPVIDYAQLEFDSKGEYISISVVDQMGRTCLRPIRKKYPAGRHMAGFSVKNLPAGSYFVRLKSNSRTTSKQLIKIK